MNGMRRKDSFHHLYRKTGGIYNIGVGLISTSQAMVLLRRVSNRFHEFSILSFQCWIWKSHFRKPKKTKSEILHILKTIPNDTPRYFTSFHQKIAFHKAKKHIFVINDSSSTEWCQNNAKKASTRFLCYSPLTFSVCNVDLVLNRKTFFCYIDFIQIRS